MTKETTAEHPPNGHVAIWAYDPVNDRWQAIYTDDEGNLQGNWPYRSTAPTIYNVTMTLANTEYSQALPAYVKRFMIQCRGAYAVKLAFTSGESGTKYLTIPSGGNYWEDEIRVAALTLYFQCATAAQVAEIAAWN